MVLTLLLELAQNPALAVATKSSSERARVPSTMNVPFKLIPSMEQLQSTEYLIYAAQKKKPAYTIVTDGKRLVRTPCILLPATSLVSS